MKKLSYVFVGLMLVACSHKEAQPASNSEEVKSSEYDPSGTEPVASDDSDLVTDDQAAAAPDAAKAEMPAAEPEKFETKDVGSLEAKDLPDPVVAAPVESDVAAVIPDVPVETPKAKPAHKKKIAKSEKKAASPTQHLARPSHNKKAKTHKAGAPAAAVAATEATGGEEEYVVMPGDTLGKISERVYGKAGFWHELVTMNGMKDPHKIFPGDKIKINTAKVSKDYRQMLASAKHNVTVQKGETLSAVSTRVFGSTQYWKMIWRCNEQSISNPNQIEAGQVLTYLDFSKKSAH